MSGAAVGLGISVCFARVIETRVTARACHQRHGRAALISDRTAAVCKLVLAPIAMVAFNPAQAMALADPAQAMALADPAQAMALADPAQLSADAIVQSTSDPSSGAALATLFLGGAAILLIGTAVEGMLGALGIGSGAEAAASAAARLTVEAAAGGADVAAGATVADAATAAAASASAVAEVGVAGGALGEAVAIGGTQVAEVATQVVSVTDVLVDGVAVSSLAAAVDIVSAGAVGLAGLVAVSGAADMAKPLGYLGALGLAAWVGSLVRVMVDSMRAAIESVGAEPMIRVDSMSTMTPVDSGTLFDEEGTSDDDTEDVGAYS